MAIYRPRVTKRVQQPTTVGNYGRFPSTNFGSYTQRGLTKHPNYAVQGPRAPSAPTAPVGSSASTIGAPATAPTADPRDSQWFVDTAKLDQYYTARKADLQAADDTDTRELAKNQGLLNEQMPKDQLSAKQGANKAGLFYSGFLGKNLGDIETSYARRRTDLQNAYNDAVAGRGRQRQELEDLYGANGINRLDILEQAKARAAQNLLDNPPAGEDPNSPAAIAAGRAMAASQSGAGGPRTKVAVSSKYGGRFLYEKRGNSWVPIRRMF